MLVPYTVKHQYFNYPIFVIGYPDAAYGQNVTTCSSAYSLRDMYCFGLGADTNAAAQIQRTGVCTINFLDQTHLDMIEFAGHRHGRDKLADPRFTSQLHAGAPVLDAAFAALVLKIQAVSEFQGDINFTAQIQTRLVEASALVDGQLPPEALAPVGYAGDAHRKVYRVPGEILKPGSFMR